MIDLRMRHHWAVCLIGMAVAISMGIPAAAAPAARDNTGDIAAPCMSRMKREAVNLRPLRIKQWTGDG